MSATAFLTLKKPHDKLWLSTRLSWKRGHYASELRDEAGEIEKAVDGGAKLNRKGQLVIKRGTCLEWRHSHERSQCTEKVV